MDQTNRQGKTKSPVEFGAKFDLSIDDNGLGRIEKVSYDAYNESTVLKEAAERFREQMGSLSGAYISRPDLSVPEKTENTVRCMEYDYPVKAWETKP